MTTTKETTTSKGPSSCESTFNEIKAYEVRVLPTRLAAVAKLPVQLLEDHNVSQVLCRTAKASCFQRAHSVHVQLELCGSSFFTLCHTALAHKRIPTLGPITTFINDSNCIASCIFAQ